MMRYFLAFALLFVAACSPIVDTRDPATAAATRTALANAPVSGNVGVLTIRLLTPPPAPTIAPAVLPTVTPTPEPLIKGNISADGRKLYHLPGTANYEQTVIDESKGERWFHTEQEALDAGWSKAGVP